MALLLLYKVTHITMRISAGLSNLLGNLNLLNSCCLELHLLRCLLALVCFHFVFLFNFLEVSVLHSCPPGMPEECNEQMRQWFITISSQNGIKNFINFPASWFCSQGSHIRHEWFSSPFSRDAVYVTDYLSLVQRSVEFLLRHRQSLSSTAVPRVHGTESSRQVGGNFQGHINRNTLLFIAPKLL